MTQYRYRKWTFNYLVLDLYNSISSRNTIQLAKSIFVHCGKTFFTDNFVNVFPRTFLLLDQGQKSVVAWRINAINLFEVVYQINGTYDFVQVTVPNKNTTHSQLTKS